MAYYERPYYQDQPRSPFGGRLTGKSVVTWLMIINIVVFLLDGVFHGSSRASALTPIQYFYFSIEKAFMELQLWRILTYQFSHADFFHILFNMIGLFFFGRMVEAHLGSLRFLVFYLLCGASGAVFMVLLQFIPGLLRVDAATALVGASGSIFGVLAAAACIAPRQTVMLIFPPIPMQMRTMVLVFMGIAVISVLAGSRNAGGEAAHIGGAILGFILIKNLWMLNWTTKLRSIRKLSPSEVMARREQAARQKDAKKERKRREDVDRVLDKVHREGLASLSKREKKILQDDTDRLSG